MLNIVLTRIDDRLIHGQVVTAWSKVTKANRIIIVDDPVAKDPFMIKILKVAAPSSIKVEIYGVEDAAKILKEEDKGENVIILSKTPQTVLKLINLGVNIKELNLGGMGALRGRKQLYKNISISDEERQAFKDIISHGVDVYIKIVPDAKRISVEKLL